MSRAPWILPLLPLLAACGPSVDAGLGAPGATSSSSSGSQSSSSGSQSSSSGSQSSSSGSQGSSSGAGGGALGETVTLKMAPFTVPSGSEVYKCQNFANPFQGKDADVAEFESHMTPGSHHLLLFYKDGATDGPLTDCSGLEFAATPYSTQLPDDDIAFPAGVAAQVPQSTGLRLQSHYLNTTGQDIQAEVSMTFHLAQPGTVTDHAGVLFVVDTNIDIAPNSQAVVKHDCTLPFDMNLIRTGSHMHKHGTAFDATIAGESVYSTTTWSEPKPKTFAPPMAVKGGDPLSFSCTFVNNGATPLTFGESAQTDEMCIFVSSFYPVPAGTATVGCQ